MNRKEWPHLETPTNRVGIVVVNYNTRTFIAQAIYSLCRNIAPDRFELVVVDNASTDGSAGMLSNLRDAGLCHCILNTEQRYHGPGLNQGVSLLAERQAAVPLGERVRYIWVLDSDCFVLRSDVLEHVIALVQRTGAAIAGQPVRDQWHDGETFGLHSLFIDPSQVWRDPHPAFEEHGSPSEALQRSLRHSGLVAVDFPFTRDYYCVHLGRGTLAEIAASEDAENAYFEWARDHKDAHFALEPEGPRLYGEFLEEFRQTVPVLSSQALIEACRRGEGRT